MSSTEELVAASFHLAGHAVVCRALGWNPLWIINLREAQQEIQEGHEVRYWSDDPPEPINKATGFQLYLLDHAVIDLAGPQAVHWMPRGSEKLTVLKPDFESARDRIRRIIEDYTCEYHYYRIAWRRAAMMAAFYGPEIRAVSDSLLEWGMAMLTDVDGVVARSLRSRGASPQSW